MIPNNKTTPTISEAWDPLFHVVLLVGRTVGKIVGKKVGYMLIVFKSSCGKFKLILLERSAFEKFELLLLDFRR